MSHPAPATTTLSSLETTPASPTRPSRLRGLSYLRSYTHNHLHSHLGGTTSRSEAPQLTRSTSNPAFPSPVSSPTRGSRRRQRQRTHDSVDETHSQIHNNGENGWLPNVQDRSLTSTSTDSASPERTTTAAEMARSRANTSTAAVPTNTLASTVRRSSAAVATGSSDSTAADMSSSHQDTSMPTIRFIPHVEARSSRPSLQFSSMNRTLRTPTTVVKVGRYSERDTTPSDPSVLPVGFKSKVVSRRHCELWCSSGQWYIKDVRSSSGTFLNHVRLSSPGVESRPYPVNDGDVVQLGIDFKGGEEVIFRCVKIRIECNRGWQKSLNNFNTSTHKRLLRSAGVSKNRDSDTASVNSSECSICLNPVAPCQALFVAPCSHVWHYKCVRNLIDSPSWPNFLCPNCRLVSDLEADVEQPEEEEEWEEDFIHDAGTGKDQDCGSNETKEKGATHARDENESPSQNTPKAKPQHTASIMDDELSHLLTNTSLNHGTARETIFDPATTTSSETTQQTPLPTPSIPITQRPTHRSRTTTSDTAAGMATTPTSQFALASSSYGMADGPMTPRNDAGPFVLDGSGGREDRLDGIVHNVVLEERELSDGSDGSQGSHGSRGSVGGSSPGSEGSAGEGAGREVGGAQQQRDGGRA